jgi:hypothetical protein
MSKLFSLIVALFVVLEFGGCASSMLTNQETSKQARIIFNVPKNLEPEKVVQALRGAFNHRCSDIKEYENLMPEELPEKPEHPTRNQSLFKGGLINSLTAGNPSFEMMKVNTSNAYYTITGKSQTKDIANSIESHFKGAIYPYTNGYKVYIYQFYKEGAKGLLGHISKAMAEKMVGQDTQLLYIAQVRDKFLELLPQAKILNQSPNKLKKVVLKELQKGI